MSVSARIYDLFSLGSGADQEKRNNVFVNNETRSRRHQGCELRKKDQAFEGLEASVCEQGAAPPIMSVFAKPSISATLTDEELSFDA
jgi:hypothetical protein